MGLGKRPGREQVRVERDEVRDRLAGEIEREALLRLQTGLGVPFGDLREGPVGRREQVHLLPEPVDELAQDGSEPALTWMSRSGIPIPSPMT